MAALLRKLYDAYYTFNVTWADERTNSWFLVGSPIWPLLIIYVYLKFVRVWGPRMMKDRKPYDLKNVLLVYNAFQVSLSIYLFSEACNAGWTRHYSFTCQPVDYSMGGIRMAAACWAYYMAKYTELFDTVFFVLRKKERHISFLHLYHHSMMIICGFIGTKFLAGGHGTFLGFINSFVHIIMYGYYLLAALGPQYQKFLWWKKYITRMQMIQFCMVFLHSLLILNKDCNYPKWVVGLLCPNAIFFYFLFKDFYEASYDKKQRQKNAKVQEKEN